MKLSVADSAGNRSDTLMIDTLTLVSYAYPTAVVPPAVPGGTWTLTIWSGHELVDAIGTAHVAFKGAFALDPGWEDMEGEDIRPWFRHVPTQNFKVTSTGRGHFQLIVPVPQQAPDAAVQSFEIFIETKNSLGFHEISDGWGATQWFIDPYPGIEIYFWPHHPVVPGI